MSRPEHTAPAEVFYGETEARKYDANSRMVAIQRQITARAIELLNLEGIGQKRHLILDVGCGSGLSAAVLREHNCDVIGVDVSPAMLTVASENCGDGMDFVHKDMGQGLGFKGDSFDGCVSISAVQWLCYASRTEHDPKLIQLYPETPAQMDLIASSALRCGFTGGVVVDYPNSSKAKKFYLVLFAGMQHQHRAELPSALDDSRTAVSNASRSRFTKGKKRASDGPQKGSKEWILSKKARRKAQGKNTAGESKFTGRKRGPKF